MKRILCLVLGTAIVLCGCATREDFVAQSNKVNQSVEDAHNQILLTNVVRAYRRRTMEFTWDPIVGGPNARPCPALRVQIPLSPRFLHKNYRISTRRITTN